MNILNHQQLLTHQLALLNCPNQALCDFSVQYNPEESNFSSPSKMVASYLKNQFKINNASTSRNSTNSTFHVLTALFMNIMFGKNKRSDLLEQLKCRLYPDQVEITNIKNKPMRNLSSNNMKKILVQFFQVLNYHKGPLEIMLDKYPIVLQIFSLFFRTILTSMKIQKAQNYLTKINPSEATQAILNYFDLTYDERNVLYIFHQENMYLYINEETGDPVYGIFNMSESQAIKRSSMFDIQEFNFEDNNEQQIFNLNSGTPKTPTPHFNQLNQQQYNFNRRKQSMQSMGNGKNNFQLKLKDSMIEQLEEEHQFKKSRQNSNQNIYFDSEEDLKKLQGIKSPIASSPDGSSLDSDHISNIKNAKDWGLRSGRSSKEQARQTKTSQHIDSKSVRSSNQYYTHTQPFHKSQIFYKNQDTKSLDFNNRQQVQGSVNSCSCTQSKFKKNGIYSNTVQMMIKPDFKKKRPQTKIPNQSKLGLKQRFVSSRFPLNNQKRSIKNQTKMPQFLAKKPTSSIPSNYSARYNYRFDSEPDEKTVYRQEQQKYQGEHVIKTSQKPKINFSYTQNNTIQRNIPPNPIVYERRSGHVYTQPAKIDYSSYCTRREHNPIPHYGHNMHALNRTVMEPNKQIYNRRNTQYQFPSRYSNF